MRFLMRWLITSIAVAVAVLVVPGIEVFGPNAWLSIVLFALVLGLLNATLGLVLYIGTIGCIVMSFGLFYFVVNAAVLMAASWVSEKWLNLGFRVEGFWPALMGSVIITLVSNLLTWFAGRDRPD